MAGSLHSVGKLEQTGRRLQKAHLVEVTCKFPGGVTAASDGLLSPSVSQHPTVAPLAHPGKGWLAHEDKVTGTHTQVSALNLYNRQESTLQEE